MCPYNPTLLPLTCAVLHCRLQPATLSDTVPSWEWQLGKVRIVSHNDHTYGCTTGMLVFTVTTSVFSLNTSWCHKKYILFYHYDTFFLYANIQGDSNMTGTDLCVNKPHCTAAV